MEHGTHVARRHTDSLMKRLVRVTQSLVAKQGEQPSYRLTAATLLLPVNVVFYLKVEQLLSWQMDIVACLLTCLFQGSPSTS